MVKVTMGGQEINIEDVQLSDEVLEMIAECCN
jgi:hypothetical protein